MPQPRMSNRDRMISLLNNRIEEDKRRLGLVKTIPLRKPVMFVVYNVDGSSWKWHYFNIIGIVDHFNYTSLTIKVLAISDRNFYPLNQREQDTTNLSYKHIRTWEEIQTKDLPLYIGWPKTYPLLTELVKDIQ